VTTHVGLMALFSLFVSVVFATMMRDDPAAQVKLGAQMFLAFVAAGIVVGWLLYPLPL
jgi:hypothetical protein